VFARCQSDRDCTLAANGWCGASISEPAQAGESLLNAIDCLYPAVNGACPPGTSVTFSNPDVCWLL
jgi:hypothetical protein